jgi:hypothetical protein
MQDFVVRAAVTIAVMTMVGLLLRLGQWVIERATPVREGEHRLAPYVGAVGLLSGAFSGFCLGAGLVGQMSPQRADFLAWAGLVVVFAIGGVVLIVTAANWRLWLDGETLQIRSEFGRTGPCIHWSEIESVKPGRQAMRLSLRGGGVFKIPFGTPILLEVLWRAQRAGARIDHDVLQEMRMAPKPDLE